MARNIDKWLGTKYDSQFESENTGVDRLSKWAGVSPQSVAEAQPLSTQYEFEDFNRLLGEQGRIDPVYGDIEEARAQAQSGAEKLGMMLPRIGAKIISETAKIPGSIYGLGEWAATGFDIDKFQESVDNAWTQAIQEKADLINEELLPVYKRREIEEGGFFKQITSSEFWATEGADGIGFLVAMMVPGTALRAAGAGQGIMKAFSTIPGISRFGSAGKLTKAGMKAADTVNDWTSAGVNTVVEAVAEGAENMKATEHALFSKRLDELLATGQYDPQEASDLAQEYIKSPEIQAKISEGGFKTFRTNLGILLLPNIIDQKWLFKGSNALEAKGVIGARLGEVVGKTSDDALNAIQRLTPKQILGKAAKIGAVGIGKEGFFEEGLQYAASRLEEQKIVNPEEATNLLETYVDSLSDTDMQKSIFLGAMLGGGMGAVGGYKAAKREDEYLFGTDTKRGVLDVFKDNFVRRYQSVNDLYKTDAEGKLILDDNNEPVIDQEKVIKYGAGIINDVADKEKLQDYAERGDKEGYEYVKSIRDFQYMVPFIKEEGGYELLKQHINNLAEKELEELANTGIYDKMTVDEVKQDLLKKADEINKVVQKADRNLITLFKSTESNNKFVKGFTEALYDSYISSEYQKNFINTRKSQLNNTVNEIVNKPSATQEVTTDTLVPGDFINFNGERQQVLRHKDGKLQTVTLDGKISVTEDTDIKDTKVEKLTDIHPIDRNNLAQALVDINYYNSELDKLTTNQEKLFTKQGQQEAFNEYAKEVDKIIKESEKIPTEGIRNEVEEAETIEQLATIRDKVIDSKEIKDKDKKTILKTINGKIRDKETELAKTQPKVATPEVVPEGYETPPPEAFGFETKEQLTQSGEIKNEEPVNYDKDRNQEGKEDELNTSEDKLAEEEFKTTYVNVAYLAIEYKDKDGTIRTKLDGKGNIVWGKDEHAIPSLPDEYGAGTEIVMFVDTKNEQYEANKDNIDSIPIAIQTLEDYNTGKEPFLYLHRMDWINNSRVAEHAIQQVTEETKAIREHIVKTGQPVTTTLLDKTGGWINKPPKGTKNPNQYTLREVIADDTRPVIAFGDKLGNLKDSVPAENAYSVMSGIPYIVLPRANETNFAIWLKQEPIKKNPNFEKYTKTVVKIIEEYTTGKADIRSLQELRSEVGKYFHVNTNSLSDELLKYENREFIFRIHEVSSGQFKGQLHVTLITPQGLREYYYKDNQWYSYGKDKKHEVVKNMPEELGKRIPNKYPNITEQGVKDGNNFEVYELQGDNLVKVKKNYIDFLSENRVVTTSVQPRVVNGVRTYFSQPNIRINTNIQDMKVLEKKSEVLSDIESKKADIEKRRQEELNSPNSETSNKSIIEALSFYKQMKDKAEVGEKEAKKREDLSETSSEKTASSAREIYRKQQEKVEKINAKYDAELEALLKESAINLEDSDIISNFEELFEQVRANKQTLTEKEVKQGERIKKYCNGTNVGKGNLIKR